MGKSFRQLMGRSGFATRDASEPRTTFEYEDPDITNLNGETLKINSINSGLVAKGGTSEYIEPSLNVAEQNDVTEDGIVPADGKDLFRAELKKYPVSKRELVDNNAKAGKTHNPDAVLP